MKGGIDDEDLKVLGDVLGEGEAGLIVFYAANMADQIAARERDQSRPRRGSDIREALTCRHARLRGTG